MPTDEEEESFFYELRELVRLGVRALKKYLSEPRQGGTITLTFKGSDMTTAPAPNYPLTALDSVEVAITFTDDNGDVVTPDAGSVAVALSSTSDTAVLDPSGDFVTITAGSDLSVGNEITVTGTVDGVAYTPGTALYDVVAAPELGGTIELAFGVETPPAAAVPASPAPAAPTAPAAAAAPSLTQEEKAADPSYAFNQVTGAYELVSA